MVVAVSVGGVFVGVGVHVAGSVGRGGRVGATTEVAAGTAAGCDLAAQPLTMINSSASIIHFETFIAPRLAGVP
jgi:hypothetical protein